jgi:hypothetical protein
VAERNHHAHPWHARKTREPESLPREIEALEAEQKQLSDKMSGPTTTASQAVALREDQRRHIEAIASSLKGGRWEELEIRVDTPTAVDLATGSTFRQRLRVAVFVEN